MSLNGPAAARLYDEHVDAIYSYAARRVGPDAAVNVVEEVFEHALRKNAERPAHTPSDLGWLLAMATASGDTAKSSVGASRPGNRYSAPPLRRFPASATHYCQTMPKTPPPP